MDRSIVVDDQVVGIEFTDCIIHLSGEFSGNLEFYVRLSDVVSSRELLRCLCLRGTYEGVSWISHAAGYSETHQGKAFDLTMYSKLPDEGGALDISSLPEEVEVVWSDGRKVLSIGHIKLKPVDADEVLASPAPMQRSHDEPFHLHSVPKGIRIETFGGGLAVRVSWFRKDIPFAAFFGVVWTTSLYWFYRPDLPLPVKIMLLCFLLVGVGVTYYAVCGFINSTRINVNYNDLTLTYGPLPWPNNRTISVPDIQRIYTNKKKYRNTKTHTSSISYSLVLCLAEDREIDLLGFEQPEAALFVEKELKRYLNIKD